jgi:hypothetical protein
VSGDRPFGPKAAGHPSVGEECPACRRPFAEGDYTTLVAYGPGGDPEEQEKARVGRPYNAVAAEVHWSCGTGRSDAEASALLAEMFPETHAPPA